MDEEFQSFKWERALDLLARKLKRSRVRTYIVILNRLFWWPNKTIWIIKRTVPNNPILLPWYQRLRRIKLFGFKIVPWVELKPTALVQFLNSKRQSYPVASRLHYTCSQCTWKSYFFLHNFRIEPSIWGCDYKQYI